MEEEYKGRAFRGDSWDILFSTFLTGKEPTYEQLKEVLNDKGLSVKDTDLTYRLINSWSEAGLFPENRVVAGKGWRKLSRLDVIWTHCLAEMRLFGLPISALKKAYQTTYFYHGDENIPLPILEFGVSQCILKRPISLIVFPDGWVEVLSKHDIEFSKMLGLLRESHITINLNSICEKVLKGKGREEPKFTRELNKIEAEVLGLISEGKLDSLKIMFKDGKPKSLIKVIRENPSVDIQAILKCIEYGELKIKKQNGKIQLVEESILERFDK